MTEGPGVPEPWWRDAPAGLPADADRYGSPVYGQQPPYPLPEGQQGQYQQHQYGQQHQSGPPYGQQGGGPPGWGPPPAAPWGQLGWGPPRRTNGMAIAALVMSLVFAPVGLILGFIARSQVRRSGEDGAGIALAAIIISAVSLVLLAALIVFAVVMVNRYPDGFPTPTYPSTPG